MHDLKGVVVNGQIRKTVCHEYQSTLLGVEVVKYISGQFAVLIAFIRSHG